MLVRGVAAIAQCGGRGQKRRRRLRWQIDQRIVGAGVERFTGNRAGQKVIQPSRHGRNPRGERRGV
jgi:hypothetical protein